MKFYADAQNRPYTLEFNNKKEENSIKLSSSRGRIGSESNQIPYPWAITLQQNVSMSC